MEHGLDYLNSLGLHKVKPGLDRIKALLDEFDNPQDKVPGIIIAGTNGKGSVAASISSILSAQGYEVGLYTSPHLVKITERIIINGIQIAESELSSIILEIKETAESTLHEQPSYFEVITAAAYIYFARKKVDFNILEVGLGGRWDATNVITPLLSIITNITLEHTEYLGETIKEIAAEKACIIKPWVPVITAAQDEALEEIENIAMNISAPLLIFKRDFNLSSYNSEKFDYSGISFDLHNIDTNMRGSYQANNIALAIAAIELLDKIHSIKINEQAIRLGLAKIDWAGRFEILRDNPPIILDSAHNPGAAKALVESIKSHFPDRKFTFLIGMLNDKGHEEFLSEISSIAEKVIITTVPSERTANSGQLSRLALKYIKKVEVIEEYSEAYSMIVDTGHPSCITGSLYLVGAIKNLIN